MVFMFVNSVYEFLEVLQNHYHFIELYLVGRVVF